jgi:hypothetical protein
MRMYRYARVAGESSTNGGMSNKQRKHAAGIAKAIKARKAKWDAVDWVKIKANLEKKRMENVE